MGSVDGTSRPHLAISVQAWADEGATLTIAGDLDVAGLTPFRRAIEQVLRGGHRHLVVDLSAATFLDCAALQELLHAVGRLQDDDGAAVVFAAPTGAVRRLLTILRFDAIVGTAGSTELAIEACQAQPITLPDGWRIVGRSRPSH